MTTRTASKTAAKKTATRNATTTARKTATTRKAATTRKTATTRKATNTKAAPVTRQRNTRKATTKAAPKVTKTATPKTAKTATSTTSHHLAAVPQGVAAHYVNRTLEGGVQDFQVLDTALKFKQNVLIEGPTGVGKTTCIEAYAEARGMPFYAISSNVGADVSQLMGKHVPAEGSDNDNPWSWLDDADDDTMKAVLAFLIGSSKFPWIDGPVTHLVRHGGVLLINEINFLPERLATVLFSLLDRRRNITLLDHHGEVIEAHPDLLIVADMNPDYEGTRRLNKALRNRFAHQLVWDYDKDIERDLVKAESLRNMADELRLQHKTGATIQTPTSTNMLIEFECIAAELGLEYAITSFVNHYLDSERQAVLLVANTYSDSIASQLGLTKTDDWAGLRL